MGTTIGEMAVHERPRERLASLGVAALRDAELVALVLGGGRQGQSAVALADELLGEFGGIDGLRRARVEELMRHPGLGAAKAAAVVAAFHLSARSGQSDVPVVLRSPGDVARAAAPHLADARRERVLVQVVDGGLRLRATALISEGSADRALVPVREVLNAVLRHDGRGFALVHNHPGGDPTPSIADRRITAEVAAGAATVGLRFLGHVVVAGDNWAEARPIANQRTPG